MDSTFKPLDLASSDIEEAILSCIFLSPKAIEICLGSLQPEVFADAAHRTIYQAAMGLYHARTDNETGRHHCDLYCVYHKLKEDSLLDDVGGMRKLTELYDKEVYIGNLSNYIEAATELWQRKTLKQAGSQIQKFAVDSTLGTSESIQKSRDVIEEVADKKAIPLISIEQGMTQFVQTLDDVSPLFDSVLTDLNKYIVGYEPGRSYVVAARTSMGKTQFALYESFMLAMRHRVPVIYFSLEMSRSQLQARIMSFLSHRKSLSLLSSPELRQALQDAGYSDTALTNLITSIRLEEFRLHKVSLSKHNRSYLSPEQRKTMQFILQFIIPKTPFFIDDFATLTLNRVVNRIKKMQSIYNQSPVVVIDYISMLGESFSSQRGNWSRLNRPQELKEIIYRLCDLGKTEESSMVLISQVNRDPESRSDKRPLKSDIKECLTMNNYLTLADTGLRVSIKDVTPGMRVLSCNEHQQIVPATVTDAWSNGVKEVFKITTRTGKVIEATANHPILTQEGYVAVSDLRPHHRVATALKDPSAERYELDWSIDSLRLIWEPVQSIEPIWKAEVFDITVEPYHCFVVNGVVTHNCGAIEERVDNIMLLYRDEYYHPNDTEDKGIIEINVAKNRDGKTGTIKAHIDLEYGCFYDRDTLF